MSKYAELLRTLDDKTRRRKVHGLCGWVLAEEARDAAAAAAIRELEAALGETNEALSACQSQAAGALDDARAALSVALNAEGDHSPEREKALAAKLAEAERWRIGLIDAKRQLQNICDSALGETVRIDAAIDAARGET